MSRPTSTVSSSLLGLLLVLLLPSALRAEETPAAAGAPPTEARESPADEGPALGEWLVVRLADGEVVSGVLAGRTEEALSVLIGAEERVLPLSDIVQVVSGSLTEGAQDLEVAPPKVEVETLEPQEFRAHFAEQAAFAEYERRRLQMVDRQGRWIGPMRLGFPKYQFGEHNRSRHHVVFLGDPELRLDLPDLIEEIGDTKLREHWDREMQATLERRTGGLALLGVGAGITLGSIVVASVAVDQDNAAVGLPVTALMLSNGLIALLSGAAAVDISRRHAAELRSYRLDAAFTREALWPAVEGYNNELRDELGLPTDSRLDAPSANPRLSK